MANQNGNILSDIGGLLGQGIQATGNIAGDVGKFLQENPDIFKGLLVGGAASLSGMSGERALSAGVLGTLGAQNQRQRRTLQMRQLVSKQKNALAQSVLDVQKSNKGKLASNFTKEFLDDLPKSAFFPLGFGDAQVMMVKTPKPQGEFAGKLGNVVEARNAYEQILRDYKNGDISMNQIRMASGAKPPPGSKYTGEIQRMRSSFQLMDEGISRILTGAAKPEHERKDFRRLYAPALTDTDETVIWKLERAARIAKRIENSIAYGDATLKEEEGKFFLDATSANAIIDRELKENKDKVKQFSDENLAMGNVLKNKYRIEKAGKDSEGNQIYRGLTYSGEGDPLLTENWNYARSFTQAQYDEFLKTGAIKKGGDLKKETRRDGKFRVNKNVKKSTKNSTMRSMFPRFGGE